MAEGRKVGLRHKAIPIDKKLKIIKDISYYAAQNIHSEEVAGKEIIMNYERFVDMQIHIPGIQKGEGADADKLPKPSENAEDKQNSDKKQAPGKVDDSMVSAKTNVTISQAQTAPATAPASNKNATEKTPSQFAAKQQEKVPDMFNNCKVKMPETFLQYKKLNPGGLEVPRNYVKYIEPVYDLAQNTSEKCWSFKKKIYEITEDKIYELINHKIDITPSDYEWVIDIFEKITVNCEGQSSVKYLISRFRQEALADVSERVSDQVMEQIFQKCWKSQREDRHNRSFLRLFWIYKDSVGPDDHVTFKTNENTKTIKTRNNNVKQKLANYQACFSERKAAIKLCHSLRTIHCNLNLDQDIKNLENLQFDKLIGKASETCKFGVLKEIDVLKNAKQQMPHIDKEKEMNLLEDGQLTKLERQHFDDLMEGKQFRAKCLAFKVPERKKPHDKLRSQLPNEFEPIIQPLPVKQIRKPLPRDDFIHPAPPADIDIKRNKNIKQTPNEINKITRVKKPIKPVIKEVPIVDGPIEKQKNEPVVGKDKEVEPKVDKKLVTIDPKNIVAIIPSTKPVVAPIPPKEKKSQFGNLEMIRMITMMIHFQEKDLGLKLTGDQILEKDVEKINTLEIQNRWANNYVGHNHPTNPNLLTFSKKIRKIEQEKKYINETFDQIYEHVEYPQRPLDEYEQFYQLQKTVKREEEQKVSFPQDNKLQEQIHKSEIKLNQLNQEYENLKSRKFMARRGRNNRIFYKPMEKAIFDYDSNDENRDNKKQKSNKSNSKKSYETVPFQSSHIEKQMQIQQALVQDLEKNCKNKRLLKNIYKMELNRYHVNGEKVGIEDSNFTRATSDYSKNPRTTNDPVIEKQFKYTYPKQYSDLKQIEADQLLFNNGLMPQNIYQNQFSTQNQFIDYQDYMATKDNSQDSSMIAAAAVVNKNRFNSNDSMGFKEDAYDISNYDQLQQNNEAAQELLEKQQKKTATSRQLLIENLDFFNNNNNQTKEDFKLKIKAEYDKFRSEVTRNKQRMYEKQIARQQQMSQQYVQQAAQQNHGGVVGGKTSDQQDQQAASQYLFNQNQAQQQAGGAQYHRS